MSHILIIGKKFSSLTNYLLDHDHEYTLLQDITATKFPNKKFKRRVLGDFSSKESILNNLDKIPTRPDAVITVYENYILPLAWIAEHLGVPGISVESAEACTDKFLMRSLFDKAPEKISPAFATVSSEEDVIKFAKNHSFPLILKPANLAKSLLVTKNNSLEELLSNYKKSLDLLHTTYKKYAPNRTPKLIIEEFLEGSIHSVEAFVDSEGKPHILDQIVDYQTGYDIGYDDNFHYSRLLPSELSELDQKSLKHCAEVGIRALGMKSSPAHVEIIMTPGGPRIVEIGARNGGYRERMHNLANGIDITGAALSVALKQKPAITVTKSHHCAVLELFPKHPGLFLGITNQEKITKLPSINYFGLKAKPEQFIGKAADGYKMCAVVILSHADKKQFLSDLEYIKDSCSVMTR
jgi:carbamoylphosphate synthase large subunit